MNNQPAAYTYITTATTTQIATGGLVLKAVVINATQTGSIKLIDGTSGTTATIASIPAGALAGTLTYGNTGITLGNGLRVITSSSADVTIVWSRS